MAAGMMEIRALTARLEPAVQRPITSRAEPVRVGISVGSALVQPSDAPAHALRAADKAMYERKRSRHGAGHGHAPTHATSACA